MFSKLYIADLIRFAFFHGGIAIKPKINFYNKKEIKKLLETKEKLIYADDGIDEIIIRYKDIPDFIVDYNNKFGQTDLKFYEYDGETMEPIITTYGIFLNYCDREVRKDIIDRLIYLQQNGKIKHYKIVDVNDLEIVLGNNIKYREESKCLKF